MPKEKTVTIAIDENEMPKDYEVSQGIFRRFGKEKGAIRRQRKRLMQLESQGERGNAISLALSATKAPSWVRLKNVLEPVLESRRLQASGMRKKIAQKQRLRDKEKLTTKIWRELNPNKIPIVQMLRGQEVNPYDELSMLKIELSEFKCIESARQALQTAEVEQIFSGLRLCQEGLAGQIKKIEDFEARIKALEERFSEWMEKIKKREQAIAAMVEKRKVDSQLLLNDWFKHKKEEKIFSSAYRQHKKQQWKESVAGGLKKMRDDFYAAKQESKESAGQAQVDEVIQESLRYGAALKNVYEELEGMHQFNGLYGNAKKLSSHRVRIEQVIEELGGGSLNDEVKYLPREKPIVTVLKKKKELDACLLESEKCLNELMVKPVVENFGLHAKRLGMVKRNIEEIVSQVQKITAWHKEIDKFSLNKNIIKQVIQGLRSSPPGDGMKQAQQKQLIAAVLEKERELDAWLSRSDAYYQQLVVNSGKEEFALCTARLSTAKRNIDAIILQVRKIEMVNKIISSDLAPLRPGEWNGLLQRDDLEDLNQQVVLLNFFKKIISDVDFWHQQVSGIGGYKVRGLQVPDGVGEMLKEVIENDNLSIEEKLIELYRIAVRRSDRKGFFSEKPIMRTRPTQAFYKVLKELDFNNIDQAMHSLTVFENEHYQEARTYRQLTSRAVKS